MAKARTTRRAGPKLPPVVYAEASPISVHGTSLFATAAPVTRETVQHFHSEEGVAAEAVAQLQSEGFDVLNVGDTTITIGAPARVYERVFKTRIIAKQRKTRKQRRRVESATMLDCPDTPVHGLIDTSQSPLAGVIEGVALSRKAYPFAASKLPPPKGYWHLDVPADVSLGMMADGAQRAGYTGKGVNVVMVDSGWFRHPFFNARGYRADPVVLGPGATRPLRDEVGHGTGESANIFAVAPDVHFTMVKTDFINLTGAFNAAVALGPDVISCSWGFDFENPPLDAPSQAMAAAVANAVAQGIIVVFSAGNGHWGFPGQHPDVISAGGAYLQSMHEPEATEYASGFKSKIYPNRRVPDVCGLVGKPPAAVYIMLPVEPGDEIDQEFGNVAFPNGDETKKNDGWAAFSGTSAAAPQVAGTCALMKQAWPQITPVQAKDILKTTARDVTKGRAAQSTGHHRAGPGADLATGSGIADATKATLLAKTRAAPAPAVVPVQPLAATSQARTNGEGVEELVLSLAMARGEEL
jgi:subtilase family protein